MGDTIQPQPPPPLPACVRKRDGRLEPFDADKISRALFAAGDALGQPDAFLSRELTDGVLFFLGQEAEDETVASATVAEVVERVVREMGQPRLAAAYKGRKQRQKPAPVGPSATLDMS